MSERIETIRGAIEVMEKCKATHLESVPISEMFGAKTIWEGVVEVFAITGKPGIPRCFAWTFYDSREMQFVVVLEKPPVVDAISAVRASIMAGKA